MMYDIIIIGAGPAGISAGIYAVSRGKRTLILEKEAVGGIIGKVSVVTHYAALLPEETGITFAKRMEKQALDAGVEILYENVTKVELKGAVKKIYTEKGKYETAKVILANGSTPRKLNILGEAELAGKGIGMNAAKCGKNYTGKNIYVVGGADGAVKEALYLAQFAKNLTILHFEDSLGCIPEFLNRVKETPNICVRTGYRLKAVYGTSHVEKLEIEREKDGKTEMIEDDGCGIFIYAGSTPNTELYNGLELIDGYIVTDEKMRTNLSGVYAAGDIRVKQVRQAATAVADGAVAAINAAME